MCHGFLFNKCDCFSDFDFNSLFKKLYCIIPIRIDPILLYDHAAMDTRMAALLFAI